MEDQFLQIYQLSLSLAWWVLDWRHDSVVQIVDQFMINVHAFILFVQQNSILEKRTVLYWNKYDFIVGKELVTRYFW